MNKLEIINEIRKKQLEQAEILDAIASEERKATNVETVKLDSLKQEIEELEARKNKTVEEKRNVRVISSERSKDNFSLSSYFRSIKNNDFSDVNDEVRELGKRSFENSGLGYVGTPLPFQFENRTLTAGANTEVIADEKFDLLLPLRSKNVFAQAGATIMTGLKSNYTKPTFTGTTAFWKGENETSADGGGGFTEKEFAPKRLTVYLPVSDLLLIQDTVDADKMLQQDLIAAINGKLNATIAGVDAGDSTKPAGLFYGADFVTSGATSWPNVVSMETAVNSANADVQNMKYIVHPNTMGKFKTTAKASGTAQFIAENSLINGYQYLTTTHLPTIGSGKGILFGNFADLYINFWNSMSVKVDNITGAKEGITNFIINLYVDAGVVREDSIARGVLS